MALLINFDTAVIKVVQAIHLQGDIRYGMSRGKHCSFISLMSVCWTLFKSAYGTLLIYRLYITKRLYFV